MPATNVQWPVPLIRFPTLWPGQMGVPGTDHNRGERAHCTGEIFYVDPNFVGVSDQRDGTAPTSPLETVEEAITKCESYRGDVIAVMHNGFWTYGDPAEDNYLPIQESVDIDVPGVRLVGVAPSASLGVPWVGTANNDVLITVSAIDVSIEGFNFWEPTYTGITGISVAWDGPPWGENATIKHCYFYDLDYGIQLDFTWNCYIEDCRFDDIDTAAIHNPSVYGEPDYLVVRNNVFVNNAADINLPDVTDCLIEDNRFLDVTLAITMVGATSNTLHNNTIQGNPAGVNNMINLGGAAANNLVSQNMLSCTIAQYDTTCSDAGSGSWVNNRCTNGPTVAPPT